MRGRTKVTIPLALCLLAGCGEFDIGNNTTADDVPWDGCDDGCGDGDGDWGDGDGDGDGDGESTIKDVYHSEGASELPVRTQMRAWLNYMTGTAL